MRMYQDTRRLDFHALGREIKRKREAKGWTQEYLAQLVDRTPRSIMYFENRGQHPSLNTFYQIVTLLDISVDQFFYPDRQNSESDCRQHIDRLLNTMDEKELTVMEATAEPNALWVVPSHPTTLPEANGSTISLTACSPLEKVPKTEKERNV